MRTIEVIISPEGETKIESRGFTGRECLAVTAELEAALGRKTSDRLTNDFFQATAQPASHRLAAGGAGH